MSDTIHVEIDAVDSTRIAVTTRYHHRDLMRRVPGAAWSAKDQVWKAPLTWASCVTLRGVVGEDLRIGPKLAEWAQEYVARYVTPGMSMRDKLTPEDVPYDPVIAKAMAEVVSWRERAPEGRRLFPHQEVGAAFLATERRALLFDEMGVGKSATAISALKVLTALGENPFPALVIAPNSVKLTWKREIEHWWPGLVATVVKGSAAERRKQLEESAHVYVMNWEALRGHSRLAPYGSIALRRCKECGGEDERVTWNQCQVHEKELNQIQFKTVIADESHRCKDPRSAQARAAWWASKDAEFRFALTGTPLANAPDDLWSILHLVDPAAWPSKTRFVDRWAETLFNAFGQATVVGLKPETRDEFFRIVDPMTRRMTKAAVLRFLPPVVRERRDVEMSPKQAKAYKQMRDQMIAELENEERSDTMIASSPLVQAGRLIQFASAYAELVEAEDERGNPTRKVRLTDPSCKIDAFLDDMPDFEGESVVVFAQSRQLIEMLSKRFEDREIEHGLITGAITTDQRQLYIDAFQAGRFQFMLCTIAAGGVGLTLTKASTAVFLQRSWSAPDMSQAEARIHRIGSEQHEVVKVIDYVTVNSIEDWQISVLRTKDQRLEEVVRDAALLAAVLRAEEKEKGKK